MLLLPEDYCLKEIFVTRNCCMKINSNFFTVHTVYIVSGTTVKNRRQKIIVVDVASKFITVNIVNDCYCCCFGLSDQN
jgi:hypothetical protein